VSAHSNLFTSFEAKMNSVLKFLVVFSIASITSSCSSNSGDHSENGTNSSNDHIFINGAIYTVNSAQPWAEAIYVLDGEIRFVGSNDDAIANAAEDAIITDLNGKMMMPGIHDVHAHPLEARSPFSGTCLLSSEEEDAEQFIAELQQCAPNQIGTNWVMGFGHSVFTLLEADRHPVDILNEAILDRPAAIMEETSHSVWVNSKALEAAGIDANTENPPGGVIVRDPDTGEATGILFDSAGDLVFDLAWQPTPIIKDLNYQGLLEGMAELNRNGITSVVEGRTYWRRGFEDAWLRAEEEDTLSVRAILGLWAYPSQDDASQLTALKALYRNNPSDRLRISQIKVYSDGIIINTTAALLEPYKETLGDIPSNNGLNYFSQSRLTNYIRELAPLGFDFHVHAIGDRGVRETLNAIEASQLPGQRHRLTHLELVKPSDYPRFSALNVTADFQVAGDFTQPENWQDNEPLIGERANTFVPLKDIFNSGARVTLSSDWDVSSLSPFLGMEHAVTRSPQNLPSLAEAVRSYTIRAAYTMRQEATLGSIEVGKRADLIVLDRNIFEIPIEQVSETQVQQTYLDGELVFQK